MAFEVNAVPRSETMGLPRRAISSVNSARRADRRSRCRGSPPSAPASRRRRRSESGSAAPKDGAGPPLRQAESAIKMRHSLAAGGRLHFFARSSFGAYASSIRSAKAASPASHSRPPALSVAWRRRRPCRGTWWPSSYRASPPIYRAGAPDRQAWRPPRAREAPRYPGQISTKELGHCGLNGPSSRRISKQIVAPSLAAGQASAITGLSARGDDSSSTMLVR